MARKKRRKDTGTGSTSGVVWMGALALLTVGVGGGYYALKQSQASHVTDETTDCLANKDAPEAVLFLVDTTDRLTRENADYVTKSISDFADKLPRYSRVIVVTFGNDLATPLDPVFSHCLPGRSGDARADESPRFVDQAYGKFHDALTGLSQKLQSLSDADSSPISQQVIRAASEPGLHWAGEKRTMVVFTDGLESSIYWTKDLKLKDPPQPILGNVSVEYHELGNRRNSSLQTPQLREQWQHWFEKAGASVRMTAPGYATQPGPVDKATN